MRSSPNDVLHALVSRALDYPIRQRPVYLEGVWGGTYMKKLRGLPKEMRNAAWVFDFIPMEVSVLVEAGGELLDINYCSFVHKEGLNLMGEDCVAQCSSALPPPAKRKILYYYRLNYIVLQKVW